MKMKKNLLYTAVALAIAGTFAFTSGSGNTAHKKDPDDTKIVLGAYYFDGWTSDKPDHLTPKLRDSFPDRKPKWGWITSKPDVMADQIDLAADAGLSFFSFCWYYPSNNHKDFANDPLNHALKLYLAAPNKNRLQFSIMIANHAGQEIGPNDWPAVTDEWVRLMKDPSYVKAAGKPFLTFFNMKGLISAFGSKDAVKAAMDQLRSKAAQTGVTIAACVSPNIKAVQDAQDCGFDMVTGYNYPDPSYKDFKREHHVDSLAGFGNWIWNQFSKWPLPYVPVATLNWDPRPWANGSNFYSRSVRYTGYNSNTVYRSVRSLRSWISRNADHTSPEHLALLYAWNEYGEGAWLTPASNDTLHLLSGVKKALSDH